MTPTLHSDALGELHLGKLDATPLHSEVIRYADLRGAVLKTGITLPTVPAEFGDFSQDFADWGMKGNGPQSPTEVASQQYPDGWEVKAGAGDCTLAGPGNETQEDAHNAARPVPPVGTKTCISQYSLLTGQANGTPYDPQTGDGDTGLNVQQVNAYRQSQGFADDDGVRYRIGQVIALTPGNVQEYVECVYLFGKVGLGVQVQQAQEDQFNAGQAWDWVPGSQIVGGHYVPGMYRLRLVTWTRSTPYTPNWYANAVDEAYAHIANESYNALTGEDANGFSEQDAEKFIVLVAQAKARA